MQPIPHQNYKAMVEAMSLRVSILVPTLGERRDEMIRLFDSLAEQDHHDLEVVVVAQGGFGLIKKLCDSYSDRLDIRYIPTEKKGLSRARNIGLRGSSGDIVMFSDDDCWYRKGAIRDIAAFFINDADIDILLTQIYDPVSGAAYKDYPDKKAVLTRATQLLSKSSAEIAIRMEEPIPEFDESFGVGGKYASGEENDYLVRSLRNGKVIHYEPVVTVYHRKKTGSESSEQLIAKGAFYAKNFGFVVSNLVLLRDLLKKRQNNYKWFWKGYHDYKRQDKRIR